MAALSKQITQRRTESEGTTGLCSFLQRKRSCVGLASYLTVFKRAGLRLYLYGAGNW